jgi:hypothetical protein
LERRKIKVTDPERDLITRNSDVRARAAERMRRHRERRRKGLRCLMIQLHETEVDALIRCGLLKSEMRNNPSVVRKALYAFLYGTLGATP